MLDRQYHLYSIDTSFFYSSAEKYLYDMGMKYHSELVEINNRLNSSGDIELRENKFWDNIMFHKKRKRAQAKKALKKMLANKADENERSCGRHHVRVLKESDLKDTDVISAFDSALSRALNIPDNELTTHLFVVQIYYFDMFRDLLFNGFIYKGEKYIYLTSSAGQIRKKKAVFINESEWLKVKDKIMCGLTVERINALGGVNANKYLAYMALANSATDEWRDFDINRAIVIDDFETDVSGIYDFVDEKDYSVRRERGSIPIQHTDGAGMVLPSVSDKIFMIRLPWIKGLLGVFDFRRFITEKKCSPVIKDIYGVKHDVIKENIQIIFTKSQFKMWKYYSSWDEYKACFNKYGCAACVCNIEEDNPRNAKINYQMLQTLTDVTDNEAKEIAQKSLSKLYNITHTKNGMMRILGVTPDNHAMTGFQRSLKLYPALLNDAYAKDAVRDAKNSLVNKYRSGKLEIAGKYTFILPDFYAACEYWFGGNANPSGLLADGEVYCSLFPFSEKVDCLRSPHLYKEHAIRQNKACNDSSGISEWFCTSGLYASCHDLISKILMYDVDGDKALVISDKFFIQLAERNMKDVVPLYYNMGKANSVPLCEENIYKGLTAAFSGGNIGTYSNSITKIWNSDIFVNGTDDDKALACTCVKRLCCQNNFVIDYAKTLYKPEFPADVAKDISRFANGKLPAFFRYAKGKDKNTLDAPNKSLINRICCMIPNQRITVKSLKLDSIDYHVLMADPDVICEDEISQLYAALNKKYRYMMNLKDGNTGNLKYLSEKIREEFRNTGTSDTAVSDMLVEYLYSKHVRYKQLLWFCYGDIIADNIARNTNAAPQREAVCAECGSRFYYSHKGPVPILCSDCFRNHRRTYKKAWKRYRRQSVG